MNPESVKLYQQSHRNHLGRPLKVDGIIGPETKWSLDFESICRARREIISRGLGHVGLSEDPPGSNDDPSGLIRSWLHRCGAALGDPWCAAFASYCLTAGLTLPVRQASAQALGRLFPPTDEPRVGDLFWYPTNAHRGHVGLVLGVGETEIMTLEGNCGNAVRVCRRDVEGLRFARTVSDTSGMLPGIVSGVPLPPNQTR